MADITKHKEEIAEESLADEITDDQPHHHLPHHDDDHHPHHDDHHHHHDGDVPEEVHEADEGSSSSSSSSSSSDGEGEKVAPVKEESSTTTTAYSPSSATNQVKRLFGREKPVHQVLGGGKPADVFLWRDKKVSAGVLGTATLIWVLFELLEYHLLTLICHVAIFALAVVFLWANVSTFINKTPPRVPEVSLPEKPLLEFAMAVTSEINRGLALLRAVASGRELKKFVGMIAGLWLLSILGSSFNFLTLFYIIFVVLHTLPALYEKHEDKVDSFAERTAAQAKRQYSVVNDKYLSKLPKVVNEKYLSKLPKVPLKDKKAA